MAAIHHLRHRGLFTFGALSFMAGAYARLAYQRTLTRPGGLAVDVTRSGGGW
ncbi:hypothetical protein RTBOTA2_000588 [Rhodotorula toruloides]|nr:hypothetical protein RTBOTA2_000588 [Rhodotorula toruloides]